MQPICFAGQTAGGRASNARPYAIDLCSDHARRGDHWSFFQWRFYIVLRHPLRQPDRRVRRKPGETGEQCSPYAIVFSTDKAFGNGTGKISSLQGARLAYTQISCYYYTKRYR